MLDLVDQLRAAVPAEIREAQEVLGRKDELLGKADEEAALRLSRADEDVERRISASEITKAAEVRAEQVIAGAQGDTERIMQEAQAQADAKRAEGETLAVEQMDEADRYAMEMLRKLEQQLDAFSASVRAGIETLDRAPAAPGSATPSGTGGARSSVSMPARTLAENASSCWSSLRSISIA